jgi:hypothetical protein
MNNSAALISNIRELADKSQDKSTDYDQLAQAYSDAADALEEAFSEEESLGIADPHAKVQKITKTDKKIVVPSKCEKSQYCTRLAHHNGRCNASLKSKK